MIDDVRGGQVAVPMIPIETTIYLSTSTMGWIVITAAEGGIGYWAQIDSYDPAKWLDLNDEPVAVPEDFVFYTIAEQNDDERGYKWDEPIDITPRLIARGLGLFLQSGRLADPDDFSVMDAAEADAVIQFGAFGELRYS